MSSKLTLNLGLRYEYATPQWERDNILTNWDPDARKMIQATDGSIYDRALVDPDRNNWGPRLGFAYTMTPKTVLRGGWGVSYVHFNRAGGGNILAINSPQVINAVAVQGNALAPTFRTTQEGYPAGFTDPSQFNPLVANITYMPRDYHSASVQSWHLSVQREIGANMVVDVAYVGNRAEDMLLFANYNQAVPNNAAGTLTLQQRRPIQDWADITYAFNGGKSRYKALMVKYEWRLRGGVSVLSSTTLSEAKDNGAGTLENQNGNAPSPQDFRNIDADFGLSNYHQPYNNTTSFVWAAAGRSRRAVDGQRLARGRSARRRMAVRGHQLDLFRRAGHLHVYACGGGPGVRHHAGFPRPEYFPSQPERRSVSSQDGAEHQQLVQSRCGDCANRHLAAVRQRATQ